MSKLNKIITNRPVVLTEEEVNNLSETLSAVRTAGGGEGGHLYTGDNKYIGVDNGNYKIKFLDNAAEKLESISSKLDKTEAATTYQTKTDMSAYLTTAIANSDYAKKTEIPDSITDFADTDTVIYSYINPATADIQQQINGKQNKLQFDLNAKGEISAIGLINNTTALAGANGITGDYYSASNPSGFINSAQAETQILEKHYLTEASGNARYIPIPEGLSDNQYYAYTTSSWKVIQGAGDVSGISTVAHDDTLTGNGNNENLGVDTTKIQTKLNDTQIQNITDVTTLKTASAGWDAKVDQSDLNDYLTKTQYGTDSATFALKTQLDEYATKEYANNASANALSEAETWVENKHYLTEVPNTYALKTDIPTTVAQLTDSGNYYTKSETSGKTEITNALNTKVDKPTSQQTGKLVYDGDNNVWVTLPAGTTTIVQGQGSVTANYDSSNSPYTVSLLASAENVLLDVNNKIDTTAVAQTYQTKSDMTNYLTTSDASTTYQPKGNYATSSDISDMATKTWVGQQGFYTKASGDNDYAPISITSTVNTLTAASAGWNNKVDKPSSLVNQYLVLRTDSNGDVSGWCDFQDQSYSKSEALGTFVATANIDTTTLSGDGKSVSTKLGVKTDVIATIDYVSGNYLPTSGGTVSGQLVVSGGSNFDTQFLKIIRENVNGHARLGLGQYGALALKADDSNSHTTQINVSPNTTNDQLVQVQHNGNQVGFLIPAVTATSTDGLTNDGILHIILESN